MTSRYGFDGLGRIYTVATEWKTKAPDVDGTAFDPANPAHTRTAGEYIRYDYERGSGQPSMLHRPAGLTQFVYDTLGRKIETIQPDGRTEEVRYDVHGRVDARWLPGDAKQKFIYKENNLELEATCTTSETTIKTTSTFDWDGRILEMRWPESNISGAPGSLTGNHLYLKYTYGQFGLLQSKAYHEAAAASAAEPRAVIAYEYNDADFRTSTEVTVRLSSSHVFTHKDVYEYDGNLRLTKIDGGGSERYLFSLNRAGYLKQLGRPMPGATAGPHPEWANDTVFTHDAMGRLTSLTEHSGKTSSSKQLSRFDYYYDTRRPGEFWDPQNPSSAWEPSTAWNTDRFDLVPAAPSLKGLKYTHNLGVTLTTYVQDFAYSGNGSLSAVCTKLRTGAGYPIKPWYELVYSATFDPEQSSAWFISECRYTDRDEDGTGVSDTTNYRIFNKDRSTIGELTYQDQSTHRDDEGKLINERTKPGVSIVALPRAYHEEDRLTPREQPGASYLVQEDLAESDPSLPMPNKQQIFRKFTHDALGNLAAIEHRAEHRDGVDQFTPDPDPAYDPKKQSMDHGSRHQYGPDGAEIFRDFFYYAEFTDSTGKKIYQQVREQTLTVCDGTTPVLDVNLTRGTGSFYQVVPGLNNRLSVRGVSPSDPVYYYRSDHDGATTLLTDESGEITFDFLYRNPDGHAEFYGYMVEPIDLKRGRVDPSSPVWSWYQPSAPRLDAELGALQDLQHRAQLLQARGWLPSAPTPGRNNYSFTDGHPYVYINSDKTLLQFANPSWWEVEIQRRIDEFHGIGDFITLGTTQQIREYWWGECDGATIYDDAYLMGQIEGLAIGLVLGGTFGELGAVGWAASAMRIFGVTQALIGVGQSTYKLATHQFTLMDSIGFLPVVVWGSAAARGIAGWAMGEGAVLEELNVSLGGRGARRLTDEEFEAAKEIAVSYGMPKERIIRGESTAYTFAKTEREEIVHVLDFLTIGPDVNPGVEPITANQRITMQASIAHEVIGHRQAAIMGHRKAVLYIEEAQASMRAAKFGRLEANGRRLNRIERRVLFRDAWDRAILGQAADWSEFSNQEIRSQCFRTPYKNSLVNNSGNSIWLERVAREELDLQLQSWFARYPRR